MQNILELLTKLVDKETLKSFIIGILIKLIGGQVSPELIQRIGVEHGKWLTIHGREALGESWEALEVTLQDTADNYLLGVHTGLNSDDTV